MQKVMRTKIKRVRRMAVESKDRKALKEMAVILGMDQVTANVMDLCDLSAWLDAETKPEGALHLQHAAIR